MKNFFVTEIAVAALVTAPAMAADLPINAPQYGIAAPPPLVAFSWTGCYLGGHFGGGFVNKKLSGAIPFGAPTFFTITNNSIDLDSTSLLIGGQVGCNLQFTRRWVIGAEFDASWANKQGSRDSPQSASATLIGTGTTTTVSSAGVITPTTDYISTATARLGYTFGHFGQGMIYAKGGAAWARDKNQFAGQVSTTACTLLSPAPPPFTCAGTTTVVTRFNFGASETRVGWTLGAGLEWAMFGNWSTKFEYDYLDLGGRTVTFNDPILPAASTSISVRISEVKFGVSYRFGDPLPTW
jgi:outer membrane immunogenic protein